MRTPQNILYHTFIGLPIEVVNSSSRNLVGMKGKIIDETKNLITIETANGREVKLSKTACTFRFYLEGNAYRDVNGSDICFRPEERAKKLS